MGGYKGKRILLEPQLRESLASEITSVNSVSPATSSLWLDKRHLQIDCKQPGIMHSTLDVSEREDKHIKCALMERKSQQTLGEKTTTNVYLSSCFFIIFSIVITSLGEEGAGLCASRAFVCFFVHVSFCHFSLPLGAGGWLRFVIVALPGLFY